ncbi:MAG: hypothetical protein NTV73_00510 [Hyphomicrobiales bacterium]|nr:hypothetical protein [Hyphomicrobiales bacterium]
MELQQPLHPNNPNLDLPMAAEPLPRDEASTGLRAIDFQNLRHAASLANLRSQVLNVHITIAWSTVGVVGDKEVGEANGQFLELMRHWLSERDIGHAWIWVLERKATVGLHSHILVHVPMMHQHRLKSWVEGAFVTATGKTAVKERGCKSVFVRTTHNWNWEQQGIWFSYVLKGLLEGETVRDGVDRRGRHDIATHVRIKVRPQGDVRTKRCGFARALGPKAWNEVANQYPLFAEELTYLEPISDRFLRLGELIDVIENLDI